MPTRWSVRLNGTSGPIPLTAPMAVVASWIDDPRGPALAEKPPRQKAAGSASAPHAAPQRPWALSPPRHLSGSHGTDITLLEIRVLDDRLNERLLQACQPGQKIRLGNRHLTIADQPELLEYTPWEVLATGSGMRAWQVRMLSPAAFRNRARTSPWPDPVTVARSLTARWRGLDPDTAPALGEDGLRSVWVSDLDGHSEVASLNGRVVSGFVGRLRYVCDGPDAEAVAFDALMAFASFAGVGSHTTFGFGTVTPEPTWQPPTTVAARRP